jgi:hypothetical protein
LLTEFKTIVRRVTVYEVPGGAEPTDGMVKAPAGPDTTPVELIANVPSPVVAVWAPPEVAFVVVADEEPALEEITQPASIMLLSTKGEVELTGEPTIGRGPASK